MLVSRSLYRLQWPATNDQEADGIAIITALERTFLGHLRTSLALASCSVLISQFFTLSLGATDTMAADEVRFRQIGKPLSCALLIWAMVTAVLGAIRFMRMQDALVNEEPVIEGGWELHIEGIGFFVVRDPASCCSPQALADPTNNQRSNSWCLSCSFRRWRRRAEYGQAGWNR